MKKQSALKRFAPRTQTIWQCCRELTFLLFAVVFVSCGGGIAPLTRSISVCKNSSHHETSELLELKMSPENIQSNPFTSEVTN